MDLSQFNSIGKANAGAFMHIKHPVTNVPMVEKDGTKVGITFLGSDSDRFKSIRHESANSDMEQDRKKTAQEIDEKSILYVAQLATGWSGIDKGGKPLEFSIEAVVELLTKEPWIKEQADAFIGRRANYLGKD